MSAPYFEFTKRKPSYVTQPAYLLDKTKHFSFKEYCSMISRLEDPERAVKTDAVLRYISKWEPPWGTSALNALIETQVISFKLLYLHGVMGISRVWVPTQPLTIYVESASI